MKIIFKFLECMIVLFDINIGINVGDLDIL